MKIADYQATFYEFSGKASDLSRQLAFAAIAIVWLFKRDIEGIPTLPERLFCPVALIVITLFFDIMQYCIGALIWFFWYRRLERLNAPEEIEGTKSKWLEFRRVRKSEILNGSEEREKGHPTWLEVPIWCFFIGKLLALFFSYILIGAFVYSEWIGGKTVGHAANVESGLSVNNSAKLADSEKNFRLSCYNQALQCTPNFRFDQFDICNAQGRSPCVDPSRDR
jgi:hypothetical protein